MFLVKVVSVECRGWEGNNVEVVKTDLSVCDYVVNEIKEGYSGDSDEEFNKDDFLKEEEDDFGFDSLNEDDKVINYEGEDSCVTYYKIEKLEDLLS